MAQVAQYSGCSNTFGRVEYTRGVNTAAISMKAIAYLTWALDAVSASVAETCSTTIFIGASSDS